MAVKSYWFYLESFVYVVVKGNNLLLYNTLTGRFLSYSDRPRLAEFLLDLNRKENLYALMVSREFLRDNGLEGFIDEATEHFMGDLIDVSLSPKKPFIMPPLFDIREEEEVVVAGERPRRTLKNVTGDSHISINELTIYVNSRCKNNCTVCNTAYKQFPWCTREAEDGELSLTAIEDILDQTKGRPIKNIDIIGGDLTLYPHLNRLVDLLCSHSFNVNFYFHHFHLKNGLPDALRTRGPRAKVNVLVDCSSPTYPGDLAHLKVSAPDGLTFLIQRDEEIPILEGVIENLNTGNISVQPYFNGHNLNFFKENVFTDEKSLTENIPDFGTINARKSQNPLNYGQIFIKSDQNIYSNLNDMPLGKIAEISMETAVVYEFSKQGNWLRLRRDVAPCKDCLLDSICPPLSNFEYASGINNSCNIWKDYRISI